MSTVEKENVITEFQEAFRQYPTQDNEGYIPDRGGFKCGWFAAYHYYAVQDMRRIRDNLRTELASAQAKIAGLEQELEESKRLNGYIRIDLGDAETEADDAWCKVETLQAERDQLRKDLEQAELDIARWNTVYEIQIGKLSESAALAAKYKKALEFYRDTPEPKHCETPGFTAREALSQAGES